MRLLVFVLVGVVLLYVIPLMTLRAADAWAVDRAITKERTRLLAAGLNPIPPGMTPATACRTGLNVTFRTTDRSIWPVTLMALAMAACSLIQLEAGVRLYLRVQRAWPVVSVAPMVFLG